MGKFELVDPMEYKAPKRPIFRVFVHCSASDNEQHDSPETMHKWHLERGFKEIGYHYFISKDGRIWEGRDIEKTPAAQANHNLNTIAICCHGLKKDKFTKAQEVSLRALCMAINKAHKGGITFHGHCEVAAKSCPVFDYKSWLKLDAHGRMTITT